MWVVVGLYVIYASIFKKISLITGNKQLQKQYYPVYIIVC